MSDPIAVQESPYQQYNSLYAQCPSRKVLDLISDRWTVLVIYVLSCRPVPKRFGAIRNSIDGISQKVLTQTLRELERSGLVQRTAYAVIPPRVEYKLTPLGESLLETMQGLKTWAENHIPDVEAAQARYTESLTGEP